MDEDRGDRRQMRWEIERRALQAAVALACVVPIAAGGAGMILGPAMMGDELGLVPATPDSHFRYLSGLLFAIGLGFAATVPHLERRGTVFRRLTALVVIGGLGRLISLLVAGSPGAPMLAALAMELLVTPALAAWQYRLERHRRAAESAGQATPAAVAKTGEILPREIGARSSQPIRIDVNEARPPRYRVLH